MDDYFGIHACGSRYHGGVCLDVLANLIGLPTDPSKSVEATMSMIVLGSQVMLDWVHKTITTRVETRKAEKWCSKVL